MRRMPHPFSGVVYEEEGEGRVRVTDAAHGQSGLFKWDGTFIEGNLTYADPHLLYLTGAPDLPPGRDIFWTVLPPFEEDQASGFTGNFGRGGEQSAQRPVVIGKYVPDPGKQTEEGMRSAAYIPQDFFLDNDRKPDKVPAAFRRRSPMPGGPTKIGVERFFSKEYHDLEVEHIWKKTWQMACREDDIPEVGDYYVYQVASLNYLVVRTGPQEIRAYVNSCLHRGRLLRERSGKQAKAFRCPYHAWSWDIEGNLVDLPAEWDFAGVREDVCKLPQARVDTWAGFVFINPDMDSTETLADYMGPQMREHYVKAKLQNRYKQADVVKVIRCNWKLAMEAFLEAYHIIATHPQLLLAGGDLADTRYDVFGNWGRLGHVNASLSSAHRDMIAPPEQVLEAYRAAADFNREYLRGIIGEEVEEYSDAELIEQSFNNLFPNFSPWGGWGRIVYRFRPNGDNPDECLMQAMLLAPWPEGKPKPPPHPTRYLGADDLWVQAPELGTLAKIFDQDCGNLPHVHVGLKTKKPPYVWYSGYQESIIRNFHRNYDERLGLKAAE